VPRTRIGLLNPFTAVFLLYAIGITVLSLARIDSKGQSFFSFEGADKLVHCFFYLGFTFLLALAYKGSFARALGRKAQIIVAIIAMTYSGIIELLQGFFTVYRSAELGDFFANSLGVIIGLVALKVLDPFFNRMKNPK
jgi:glycopeptide antibiotics resistance protein